MSALFLLFLLEQGYLLNKKNAISAFTSLENKTVSKKCLCEPFSDFLHRPILLHLYNVANSPNWQGFKTMPFIFSKKFQIMAEDKVLKQYCYAHLKYSSSFYSREKLSAFQF